LQTLKDHFELIVWQSSQLEYAKCVCNMVEEKLGIKFDHSLSIADQSISDDNTIFVKNLDTLKRDL
jgi:hypothetical protein